MPQATFLRLSVPSIYFLSKNMIRAKIKKKMFSYCGITQLLSAVLNSVQQTADSQVNTVLNQPPSSLPLPVLLQLSGSNRKKQNVSYR